MVERESAYCETYQNEIMPERQDKIQNQKDRLNRKAEISNQLAEEEDERQRVLAERRDQ